MFLKKCIFLLLFLSVFNSTNPNPDLSLENLHALTLCPATAIDGQKCKFIPDWFEKIQKNGIPARGIAFVPTNSRTPFWQFNKGIPRNLETPIFVHSGPHSMFWNRLVHGRTGQGLRCTNAWLKNSIVTGTLVTFDNLYDYNDFDFGQGINISALNAVYSQVHQNNPHAPLVIAATCIGAKIALECVCAYAPQNLAAMVLENPFIDANKFLANIGKNYLNWLPFADDAGKAKLLKGVTQWYAPNCKETLEQTHADLSKINPKLPIFIAHLKDDSMYTDEQMHQLVTDLCKSGNKDIYLLVIKDSKTAHGHLNQKKEFAQSTNAFLARYNLPHDKTLAKEGKALLADAQYNAQAASNSDWRIVVSEKVG